jgi:peptidoglycan LD-endopeptidase CwlK
MSQLAGLADQQARDQLLFRRKRASRGIEQMTFKLSNRSLEKLEGVDDALVAVVRQAIGISKIDFGVICGMRTIQEQEELVARGASQTMKSKHLDGKAVDLMAYIGSRASWELNLYDDIADAMAIASRDIGVR